MKHQAETAMASTSISRGYDLMTDEQLTLEWLDGWDFEEEELGGWWMAHNLSANLTAMSVLAKFVADCKIEDHARLELA
jgi:hypothetical protein